MRSSALWLAAAVGLSAAPAAFGQCLDGAEEADAALAPHARPTREALGRLRRRIDVALKRCARGEGAGEGWEQALRLTMIEARLRRMPRPSGHGGRAGEGAGKAGSAKRTRLPLATRFETLIPAEAARMEAACGAVFECDDSKVERLLGAMALYFEALAHDGASEPSLDFARTLLGQLGRVDMAPERLETLVAILGVFREPGGPQLLLDLHERAAATLPDRGRALSEKLAAEPTADRVAALGRYLLNTPGAWAHLRHSGALGSLRNAGDARRAAREAVARGPEIRVGLRVRGAPDEASTEWAGSCDDRAEIRAELERALLGAVPAIGAVLHDGNGPCPRCDAQLDVRIEARPTGIALYLDARLRGDDAGGVSLAPVESPAPCASSERAAVTTAVHGLVADLAYRLDLAFRARERWRGRVLLRAPAAALSVETQRTGDLSPESVMLGIWLKPADGAVSAAVAAALRRIEASLLVVDTSPIPAVARNAVDLRELSDGLRLVLEPPGAAAPVFAVEVRGAASPEQWAEAAVQALRDYYIAERSTAAWRPPPRSPAWSLLIAGAPQLSDGVSGNDSTGGALAVIDVAATVTAVTALLLAVDTRNAYAADRRPETRDRADAWLNVGVGAALGAIATRLVGMGLHWWAGEP